MKEKIREELQKLIADYHAFMKTSDKNTISEETIRTWVNAMLLIFGWDVRNTTQVLQERTLSPNHKVKLEQINSTHSRPDYILLNGQNIKAFIDAKDLSVNIFSDVSTAFQVRSYGWSASLPCSFATNFEQFVIYDCRFKPDSSQSADMGTLKLNIGEYIDKIEILIEHLYISNVKANKLEELYSVTSIEGKERLDRSFNAMLTDFRLKLAENLLNLNPDFNLSLLNYYVQVILDRIIFIRICESRGIELRERLKAFKSSGFWDSFKNCCYMEFYNHYDGAMFDRDSIFQNIILSNGIFDEFVDKLYYPYPYKFDVMPVKVIAQIYEDFLSKQLTVSGMHVIEELKSEYIKEKGAISTPEYLVDAVCKNAISLDAIGSIDDVLKLRILDPACGSGTFMVSCFDLLTKKVLELWEKGDVESQYRSWFIRSDNYTFLTIEARREIIRICLFGIDVDEAAVEVTKMSLALKIIDNNDLLSLSEIGAFGDRILREIHENVKLGNTLVDSDLNVNLSIAQKIKPLDIKKDGFTSVFKENGGFDYIIGNPPYVETKHYKLALPEMHEYLRNKYKAFEGKADLSVIFIERCLDLLNSEGKLGFIVQKRFFKTTYGKGIRKIISQNNHLFQIIDITTDKLFHGRMTYVAIIIVSRASNEAVKYQMIPFEPLQVKTYFENETHVNVIQPEWIPSNYIGEDVWAFESFQLFSIIQILKDRHGTFGEYETLKIKDGIQALWKKAYHFDGCKIEKGYLFGKNGFDEDVKLEEAIVRPLIYNRAFHCFKKLVPHAYSLFPYRLFDNKTPISMVELKAEFPCAYDYLIGKKSIVESTVQHYDDTEFWHIFTREHNHDTFLDKKIVIPMTAKDTIGALELTMGLYMDNANVWFVKIDNASDDILKAICAIVNSTIFSVLAKAKANPQSGGYYKLNKQFLMPVPFPSKNIIDSNPLVKKLAELSDEISESQEIYLTSTPNTKEVIRRLLEQKWHDLDNICYELYQVTDKQMAVIQSVGRSVDRVKLLDGVQA